MPITPPPTCDYATVFAETVKFSGWGDPNYPDGSQLAPNAPVTSAFLKKRILQHDYEISLVIASVQDHPYRPEYVTEDPDPLNSGDLIPAYLGVHTGVRIKQGLTFNIIGRLAEHMAHLQRIWKSYVLYGSPTDLYWIENGRIFLSDASGQAKVLVPTIPKGNAADVTPTLYSPAAYQNGLLANTLGNLRLVGSPAGHRNDWFQIWVAYREMIRGKALSLPEPERMQRIAT